MEFLNSWIQQIIVAVIIATIIEMILPNGNSKKYIKVVLGVYIMFNIISPIINKVTENNFDILSMKNVEKYIQKTETYEASAKNTNIENTNEFNIKEIYISKLKNEIIKKLQDKEYYVDRINIKIEDNPKEYKISKIEIYTKEKSEDVNELINIDNIKTINIQISNKDSTEIENSDTVYKSKVSEKDKREIKHILSEEYEINQDSIYVY